MWSTGPNKRQKTIRKDRSIQLSRGKHKKLSERRREASEELNNLSIIKKQLLDTTKENIFLKEKIKSDQESHKKEVNSLNSRIIEAASEELENMREINRILISKLDEIKDECKSINDKWGKTFVNFREYIQEKESLSSVESLEKTISLVGEPISKDMILDVDDYAKHIKKDGMSEEDVVKRIIQLQKIRRVR
jgi:hypothetical protein